MQRLILVTLALLAVTQGRAAAHAFLDNAVPKVGATVAAPAAIRLQFTQSVEPAFSHIKLVTAMGQPVALGAAAGDPADGTILSAPVTGPLPPGQYEVQWDVVSVDTHRTNGHFPLTIQP